MGEPVRLMPADGGGRRRGPAAQRTRLLHQPERSGRPRIPVVLVLALLSGCAAPTLRPADPALAECLDWLGRMDRAVAAAGVTDAGAARIDGFPHLRVSRYLASFRAEPGSQEQRGHWVAALAAADREARRAEWANLPPAARAGLQPYRAAGCSARLVDWTLQSPAALQRLGQAAVAPDSYVTWQQLVGLYPIPALIAGSQIGKLHERLRAGFRRELADYGEGITVLRYRPGAWASAGRDAGVPEAVETAAWDYPDEVAPGRWQALFARHAPVLEVLARNDRDHIGSLALGPGRLASVNTADPAVYLWPSRARFGDRAPLQLNYLFWFPARDTDDIYGGDLDGLIWRVTLDARDRPLAYDTIHACGCYYTVLPGPGFRARPPPPGAEPVLSLPAAPRLSGRQRLRLRLDPATHYLSGIDVWPPPGEERAPATRGYRSLPYAALRSLRGADGRRAGLFDARGLVPQSRRPERFLFWPLGVASAGAMRQPGTHAIAFVGRRHFDDPYLLQSLIAPEAP